MAFRRVCIAVVIAALLLATCGSASLRAGWPTDAGVVRVIVLLVDPPLATHAAGQRARLDLTAPDNRAYLRYLDARQDAFRERLVRALPGAEVEHRYRILLNGVALRLRGDAAQSVAALQRMPEVRGVYPERAYALSLSHSVPWIGAPALWDAVGGVDVAGDGIKIAIIDSGITIGNPFLRADDMAYPAGYPKGESAYTTPKVIVARAYLRADDPPAAAEPANPLDGPYAGGHGTHVAGIAAGAAYTDTPFGALSGVAPRARLLNYKVFYWSQSSAQVGKILAYSPELVAAMEDAVADGADVVNGSWGGTADLALDADPMILAAEAMVQAGVVAVFAAGNDGPLPHSANSPGIAPHAIAVGNTTTDRYGGKPDVLNSRSSRGPGLGLQIKPDLAAPGTNIYSSAGTYFTTLTGTSMSAPHVAGGAALLRQLHPAWTPAQIKAALMTTAHTAVWASGATSQLAEIVDQGAGRIALAQAADPGLFLSPPSISFGELRAGTGATITLTADALVSGVYTITIEGPPLESGVALTTALTTLALDPAERAQWALSLAVATSATPGDYAGRIWLTSSERTLHVPWLVRVLPAAQFADVLLLDDDGSSLDSGVDYLPYYTAALDALGLSHDVWDVGLHWQEMVNSQQTWGALPSTATTKGYRLVIWFTGDNRNSYAHIGATEPDRARMRYYVQSDGRLLITGQDWSGYELGSVDGDPTELAEIGLGAAIIAADICDLATSSSSVAGEGIITATLFAGVQLDLRGVPTPTLTSGAGNQRRVDEIAPIGDYQSVAVLRARLPGSLEAGAVAVAKSADATLEQPVPAIPPGRSLYLSFGLEGVRDDTGQTTRAALLARAITWLTEELTVTVSVEAITDPRDPVVLTAVARSSAPDVTISRYRWDLGDGSPLVESLWPYIAHVYREPGTYHPRVEVLDSLGHTALSARAAVVVREASWPYYIFLPRTQKR